jgi:hypothetical protein
MRVLLRPVHIIASTIGTTGSGDCGANRYRSAQDRKSVQSRLHVLLRLSDGK